MGVHLKATACLKKADFWARLRHIACQGMTHGGCFDWSRDGAQAKKVQAMGAAAGKELTAFWCAGNGQSLCRALIQLYLPLSVSCQRHLSGGRIA